MYKKIQTKDAAKMQNFKVQQRCICIFGLPAKPLKDWVTEGAKDAVHFKMHMHFKDMLEALYIKGYRKMQRCRFFLYINIYKVHFKSAHKYLIFCSLFEANKKFKTTPRKE